MSGQNESFLHAVIQAQQAQRAQRTEDAWSAVGLFLVIGILALALVARWIFRGGLGRAFPSIRRL